MEQVTFVYCEKAYDLEALRSQVYHMTGFIFVPCGKRTRKSAARSADTAAKHGFN